MTYDLIVVGSGPAGYTASIYAKRAGLNVVLITGLEVGGQLMQTTHVENWPGNTSILGTNLMENMKAHVASLGVQTIFDYVKDSNFSSSPYQLIGENGTYQAKAVIIATGSSAKWLGTQDEAKFKGFGVSACATCDGFFYKNQVVAVVGGGNSAMEEATYLANIASKVYMIHRRDDFRGEQIMKERVLSNPKIEVLWDSVIENMYGSENPVSLEGLTIKNLKNGELKKLPVNGLFVAIGHNPNTNFVKGKLDIDEDGYLLNHNNTGALMSNCKIIPGVFGAGDVIDKVYRQAVLSAGTGCRAALDVKNYLG
jgi:thioredoxin reductase (NADPH)